MLAKLLGELQHQVTNGLFSYSIVVVDNDSSESAKPIVKDWQSMSVIAIDYYNEPEQNIALARNKAVENAKGNFIAFIDDDEFPIKEWLLNLYNTCREFGADAILGPVKPHFDKKPPEWLVRSKLCDRESYKTGTTLHWEQTRTGNALLKRGMFDDRSNRFDSQLGRTGGEDIDFFRRSENKGYSFVWCNEAIVFETVPQERWSRSFHIKKYFRIGGLTGEKVRKEFPVLRLLPMAVIALSFYSLALPFAFVVGHHLLMQCLVKVVYYFGWFAGFCARPILRYREE